MLADYQVAVLDWTGATVDVLDTFTKLHYTRTLNDVSKMTVTLEKTEPARIGLYDAARLSSHRLS